MKKKAAVFLVGTIVALSVLMPPAVVMTLDEINISPGMVTAAASENGTESVSMNGEQQTEDTGGSKSEQTGETPAAVSAGPESADVGSSSDGAGNRTTGRDHNEREPGKEGEAKGDSSDPDRESQKDSTDQEAAEIGGTGTGEAAEETAPEGSKEERTEDHAAQSPDDPVKENEEQSGIQPADEQADDAGRQSGDGRKEDPGLTRDDTGLQVPEKQNGQDDIGAQTPKPEESEAGEDPADTQPPEAVLHAAGGIRLGEGSSGGYLYSADSWKGAVMEVKDPSGLRVVEVSAENTSTGRTKTWRYSEDEESNSPVTVDEAKTSVRFALERAAELKDGQIRLTVRAEDRCGNRGALFRAGGEDVCLRLYRVGKPLEEPSGECDEAVFIMDTTAPQIEAEMTQKGNCDVQGGGMYYYRASNCGMEIRISDPGPGNGKGSYCVSVKNEENHKELVQEFKIEKAGNRGRILRRIPGEEDEIKEAAAQKNVVIRWSDAEVQRLGEGLIHLTVTADDLAGNKAETMQKASGMKTAQHDGCMTGSFILDMTCPVVTSIRTEAQAHGIAEDGALDAAPYKDGKEGAFYYYSDDTVCTVFSIREKNPERWTVSWRRNGNAEPAESSVSFPAESAGSSDQDVQKAEVTYGYGLVEKGKSAEGRYTEIAVAGADRAGNPLKLQKSSDGQPQYTHTGEGGSEVDAAQERTDQTGRGIITLCYGKVVDHTAPVALVSYSTKATAWLYDGTNGSDGDPEQNPDHYSLATAYVNQSFSTSVYISDFYGRGEEKQKVSLDFDRLTVQQAGHGGIRTADRLSMCRDGTMEHVFTVSPDPGHTTDGGYYYKVFGTDRAGNAVCVRESFGENTKMAHLLMEDCYETKGCAESCRAKFRIMLDTVSPVFNFTMADPQGGETIDGMSAYYGSVAKELAGMYEVRDSHLDPERIHAGYAFRDQQDITCYDRIELTWEETNQRIGAFRTKGESCTCRVQADQEGVYRFAVCGTDKAGNALVQSPEEQGKTGYRATFPAGNKDGTDALMEAEPDSRMSAGFWTGNKILDRTAPAGVLEIGNGKESYYHVDLGSNGTNTLAEGKGRYAPYRKETAALVTVTAEDPSPVRASYRIVSSVSGQDQKYNSHEYQDHLRHRSQVIGEQIFHVEDLVLTDRAGNRTGFLKEGFRESNRIYLDVTPPVNKDLDRPVAVVTATGKVTRSRADGRDLFNHAADLKIRVVDPNEHVKSAGLARVSWTVKADGKKVLRQTINASQAVDGRRFHTGPAKLYQTETLDHVYEKTIHLGTGGVYETNDIEVVVTAEDNAGNVADQVTYRCGIDTKGPEITVRFDNNSAMNGRYFKKPRTASVIVQDRNVDSSRIHIQTQASHTGGFRNIRHTGNGENDLWEHDIHYIKDGDYTLAVSGTDALGNAASIHFEGTAPREFTIDSTAPEISISFDIKEGYQGSRFFNRERTAVVSIREHNFRDSDALIRTGGIVMAPEERKKIKVVPEKWNNRGDLHTVSCRYGKDGDYTLSAGCTDLAGNAAVSVTAAPFTIDTTKPEISIEGESFQAGGVYTGTIAPRVRFGDNHYDPKAVSLRITGCRTDRTINLKRQEIYDDGTGFGGRIIYEDFPGQRTVDDIYTVDGVITDRAGNTARMHFQFSVNRFGSTYDYNGDPVTLSFVNSCRQQAKDLCLREINVCELVSREVYLSHDHDFTRLIEGKDYTVTCLPKQDVFSGYVYLYTLSAKCFADEGQYRVTVQSVDTAGNMNTNDGIREEGGKQASVPLSFVIDRTNPTVSLRGVDPTKRYWRQDHLNVEIVPEDGNRLACVQIWLDGCLIGTWLDNPEDIGALHEGEYPLSDTLEANMGVIPFCFGSSVHPQHLHVEAVDAAGNRSVRSDEVIDWSPVIHPDPLVQFYNRKKLFFGVLYSAGGLLLLLIILLIRKLSCQNR